LFTSFINNNNIQNKRKKTNNNIHNKGKKTVKSILQWMQKSSTSSFKSTGSCFLVLGVPNVGMLFVVVIVVAVVIVVVVGVVVVVVVVVLLKLF